MKLVIDIPFKVYGVIKYFESALDSNYEKADNIATILIKAVLNGTPLPKGHGILIDINEITAFKELECNGHNVESLDEFTTIIEADKEVGS